MATGREHLSELSEKLSSVQGQCLKRVREEGARNVIAETDRLVDTIADGENLLIEGVPGSGKTRALTAAFRRLVELGGGSGWSPVMLLTPDRRRADQLEAKIGPEFLGSVRGPGGHRLIRGVNSYAYQVLSQWLVERDEPLPRPVLTGGADEDVWFATWLREHAEQWATVFPPEAAQGDALRMEVRNGLARAGERGIGPEALAQIGRKAGVPAWEMLAAAYQDYAGAGPEAFSVDTSHVDSARIQVIAAGTLLQWQELRDQLGVRVPPPVPAVVLIDDLQDCTPATVQLLAALGSAGAQIVAAYCPVSGTGSYRGAGPETASLLFDMLPLRRVSLTENHRSYPQGRAIVEGASQWVQPTRPDPARAAEVEPSAPIIVTGEGRRGAWIAQQIRRHHFLEGIRWDNQAVLVRSAADIETLRRQLMRAQVPLASAERSLQFGQIPVTRALLELLTTDGSADPGGTAMRLLASPLVNIDRLALYRFLRDHGAGELGYEAQILDWLAEPSRRETVQLDAASSRVQEQLMRASRIWRRKEAAAEETAQVGLWQLWEAADLAKVWQKQVLEGGPDAERADDRLDAVMALFRRADLWEQQQGTDSSHPQARARDFAEEILAQTVASDSIAQAGLRGPGVEILTVSQAAGRQWDVVYVSGLQDGVWPPRVRPGGVLEIPRLEQTIRNLPLPSVGGGTDMPAIADPGVFEIDLDQRAYRLRRRKEEAALFVAAASRAVGRLYLVAVDNESDTASPFLGYLAAQGILEPFRREDGETQITDVPPAFDIETMTATLRRSTVDPNTSEAQRRQAAALLALMASGGVEAANPANWVGAGGLTSDSPLLGRKSELRVGPSSLNTGSECALQWFFRAAQGDDRPGILQQKEVSPADIGNLIHALAEQHPDGDEKALRAAFSAQWDALGLDSDKWLVQRQKADVEHMVENLGAYLRSTSGKVQVEQAFTTKLGSITLAGRMDRVETRPDGSVRIVDIKTTKTSPSKADVAENLQLSAYQLALRDSVPVEEASLLLVHPRARRRDPLRVQPALTDGEAAELREELTELGNRMLGPSYTVRPVRACDSCRFRAICPVQDEGVRSVP